MKTRFIIVIAALVLVSAGWTLGWRFLSAEAAAGFETALERANQNGQTASCENMNVGGFPFRLSISCERSSLARGDDLRIDVSGLHAQTLIYRPSRQVVNFQSPAEIQIGRLGALELTWQAGRIGSNLGGQGLSATSAKIEGARLRLVDPPVGLANTALEADSALLSARRSEGDEPDRAVVFALDSNRVQVLGERYRLPPFDLDVSVLAHDLSPLLDGHRDPFNLWIDQGGEADVQMFRLTAGEAELFARGWIKLDQDGFFNADLNIDSANLDAFAREFGAELQQIQSFFLAAAAIVSQVGEDVLLNERPAKRINLSIRRGFVKAGVIPLGVIPQVTLPR